MRKIVILIGILLIIIIPVIILAQGTGETTANEPLPATAGKTEIEPPTWIAPEDFIKPEEDVLRQQLTPLQFTVTQEDGTERPFDNLYWDNKEPGIYVDVVSGEPLFSSIDKYKSGTGWPSFTQPLIPDNIVELEDNKLFATRTEIRSKFADSHLGHVFNDGPTPTGLRYCMNSAALRFIPLDEMAAEGYDDFLYLFEDQDM